mmetsp:Transcript_4121/g.6181  ORF Transcript_4121/g.6181 Transcript_4121/m.6181 type:complete len:254 (+) Transcript_4121:1657-2418(+)
MEASLQTLAIGGAVTAVRWICKCEKRINTNINLTMDHLTFSDENFRAADIANAVATVELPEKFNCIALLSGIVDFKVIGKDVIMSNICDRGIKPLPVDSMKYWNQSIEFNKWKELVSGSIETFRQPYKLFDFNGRFVTRKACFTKQEESTLTYVDNFKTSEMIDMTEYIFFSVAALKKLFSHSESISVAFIDNHWMKSCASSDCLRESTYSNPKKYSSANVKDSIFRSKLPFKVHPFWILKAACKDNKCVEDI